MKKPSKDHIEADTARAGAREDAEVGGEHLSEGATAAQIGALDGAAAAGANARFNENQDDGAIPTDGFDPRFGPD
ncbi:MAG: hypothetical protein M3N47_12120 [Chloroflexota bacterium]|nr:hypothetical protein [Chloroflexota bacterium]